MNKLRLTQKYLFLACVLVLFAMYFSDFMEGTDYIAMIFKTYPDEFASFSDYMKHVNNFDNFMSGTRMMLPVFLPILAILPTFHYYEEIKHFFLHGFIRKEKYNQQLISSLFINAFIIATYIYISYVLVLGLSSFIFPIVKDSHTIYDVLADVVGHQLFLDHKILHYALAGLLQIWVPVFITSLLTLILMLIFNKIYLPATIVYCSFLFLSIFMSILAQFFDNIIFYYLNPSILINLNGIMDPSTLYALLGHFVYFAIAICLVVYVLVGKERLD